MITLRNVTLRRGVKVVLDNASVTLNPGEKVGLVGRNGAGKSSLFSMLAARLSADAGDVEIPPKWRLGEVAQEIPEVDTPATEFVLQGDIPLMEAQTALEAAEAADDGEAMAEAHMALEEAGAFDARPRAQALLLGLGFRGEQLEAPVNSFSGGWRMRLQLARALMCPSDLMLLDEPTNHLDLDALVWLEGWLQRYNGTLLIISHDREFLDAITTVTLHLDDAKLTRYGGNYTRFEEMRAERMEQQAAAFAKQQDRIAHLQKFIDRFKAKATKAKQAQSRVKALARMERLAPVLTSADFTFDFREPLTVPNPMLAMRDVVCGYMVPTTEGDEDGPLQAKPIVTDITRTVLAGQRIGILGANGQGKSTVVKTLTHTQPALGGTMTEGKGLSVGYFAQQEMDLLHADDTPLQYMVRLAKSLGIDAREQELRDFLGQFRFVGDMVHQSIGTLSGGEKARLVLGSLVWQRPNLLLLDEPTNHLDLTTREALSMALNGFEGTLMLVSHDRALLREVCDEFWLVADGKLSPFDGDLDDYQRWLQERSREAQRAASGKSSSSGNTQRTASASAATPTTPPAMNAVASAAATPTAPAASASPAVVTPTSREDRKAAAQARAKLADLTRPLRTEQGQIDKRLEKLGAEKLDVESQLSSPGLAGEQFAELGRRLSHVQAEMAMLEERWLELGEQIESLQQQHCA